MALVESSGLGVGNRGADSERTRADGLRLLVGTRTLMSTIRQMPETSCMPDSVGKPAPQRVQMISSAIYQLCALGI